VILSRTLGLVGEEIVHFAGRAVVRDDGEAFVVHVQDQILALQQTFETAERERRGDAHHDGEADEADITAGLVTG